MTQKQGYHGAYRSPDQSPSPSSSYKRRSAKKKKKSRLPIILTAVVSLLLLSFVIYYAYCYFKIVKPTENTYLEGIYIDDLDLGGMTPNDARQALLTIVRSRQESWSLQLTYHDHVYYTLTKETIGINTDENEVYSLLNEAFSIGHRGGTFQRMKDISLLKQEPYRVYTTQSEMTTVYLDQILQQIADNMYREPQDAYLAEFLPDNADPFIIEREQTGCVLDIDTYREKILSMASAGTSGSLELVPEILLPSVTTEDVRATVSLRGTGITPISSSSTENRNNNIRVAFSRYNGLTVENGKKISFNDIVGERTVKNGFYEALEYVNGDLTTGIGGGVCQASTTIYKAALLSNLKINKREPHSEEVSYTVFGQDATVYWGGRKIDFVFTNNSGGTIYITAHVEKLRNNTLQCVVNIYGLPLGDGVYYTLDTRTVEIIPKPLEAEYAKDTKQEYVTYTDEEYLIREGRDGYINETYLQKWVNGNLISEAFVSKDIFEAKADRFLVGTQKPLIQ